MIKSLVYQSRAIYYPIQKLGVDIFDILLISPIAESLPNLDFEKVEIGKDESVSLQRLNTLVEINLER